MVLDLNYTLESVWSFEKYSYALRTCPGLSGSECPVMGPGHQYHCKDSPEIPAHSQLHFNSRQACLVHRVKWTPETVSRNS